MTSLLNPARVPGATSSDGPQRDSGEEFDILVRLYGPAKLLFEKTRVQPIPSHELTSRYGALM